MQQLFAAFGVKLGLLIAQAVNFGVVLIALTYFLYKPVLRTLEERRKVIAQGVADAQEAGEKLAHADETAAARVIEAEGEAEQIVRTAREAAGLTRAELLKDAEARAASVVKDAEARAVEEAARLRRESEKEVARLAVLASAKLMQEGHD